MLKISRKGFGAFLSFPILLLVLLFFLVFPGVLSYLFEEENGFMTRKNERENIVSKVRADLRMAAEEDLGLP